MSNIELLHTLEVRIWPYFPRRSRVKFGQYAPNGCEVTILSNDWNESYCYRCISTFQLFKYPQKLDNSRYVTFYRYFSPAKGNIPPRMQSIIYITSQMQQLCKLCRNTCNGLTEAFTIFILKWITSRQTWRRE